MPSANLNSTKSRLLGRTRSSGQDHSSSSSATSTSIILETRDAGALGAHDTHLLGLLLPLPWLSVIHPVAAHLIH